MNSATHLMNEDRPEFERVLDEALRAEDTGDALAGAGAQLNTEQLRTLALNATAAIAACAATEYQHYVKIREQIRSSSSPLRGRSGGRAGGNLTGGPGGAGLAGTMGEVTESTGAGLVAVVTVLTPILAGTASLIFLLVGYSLELLTPEPSIAPPLRTAGWFFALLAAAGLLLGMVALLLTALRNPAADAANARVESSAEVAGAREAWRRALLERGLRPFLHQVLADAAANPEGFVPPSRNGAGEEPPSRHPRLGYSRPGFSSPNPDDPGSPRRGPEFSRPEYSKPEYSSPDFSSPDFDTGAEGFDHPDPERAP